jgi:hypothetical protein
MTGVPLSLFQKAHVARARAPDSCCLRGTRIGWMPPPALVAARVSLPSQRTGADITTIPPLGPRSMLRDRGLPPSTLY